LEAWKLFKEHGVDGLQGRWEEIQRVTKKDLIQIKSERTGRVMSQRPNLEDIPRPIRPRDMKGMKSPEKIFSGVLWKIFGCPRYNLINLIFLAKLLTSQTMDEVTKGLLTVGPKLGMTPSLAPPLLRRSPPALLFFLLILLSPRALPLLLDPPFFCLTKSPDAQRKQIVQEMVETERNYLTSLRSVVLV
jgi:hypothetical protein